MERVYPTTTATAKIADPRGLSEAQIKQLIEQHKLPKPDSEEYFNFIDRGKVRRITADAALRADFPGRGCIEQVGLTPALQALAMGICDSGMRGLYDAARASSDWEPLVKQYEKSLKKLRKQPGELETMLRLAQVLWREVEDLERAEYYFKRIKLLDSENDSMLRFYEVYFEERSEWRKLFAMLSTAQQNSTHEERKRELTQRLAQIAEQSMSSPEKAIDVWKSFVREHPADPEARAELHRLYEQNNKWSLLVDFYKDELHAAQADGASDAERVQILRKMAEIYDDRLGLEPMVINTLQDVLELDPADEASFARLRELLVSNRRMNDLANMLNALPPPSLFLNAIKKRPPPDWRRV